MATGLVHWAKNRGGDGNPRFIAIGPSGLNVVGLSWPEFVESFHCAGLDVQRDEPRAKFDSDWA